MKEEAEEPTLPVPPMSVDIPDALIGIVQGWKGWRPATEVLVNVRSVQTCFLGMDRALKVGGFPLGRMYVVHGPTGGGKSSFILGLVRSFLERGNIAALVDAEHTTTEKWTRDMVQEHTDNPLFIAQRPRTYEETVEGVDQILKGLKAAKKVKPDLGTLIIVDSLNKLTPERELTQVMKDTDNLDKGWGRQRANMNQAWIDHLTPLLAENDAAILFVAQERTKKDASPQDTMYGNDWEVKGGKGVIYDSSLVFRVTRASWIKEEDTAKSPVLGTRHKVRLRKSKVEWLGNHEDFFFHVRNGEDGNPAGFDFARDLFEVGIATGVLESTGWVRCEGVGKWHGEEKFLQAIESQPGLIGLLTSKVRAAIAMAETE